MAGKSLSIKALTSVSSGQSPKNLKRGKVLGSIFGNPERPKRRIWGFNRANTGQPAKKRRGKLWQSANSSKNQRTGPRDPFARSAPGRHPKIEEPVSMQKNGNRGFSLALLL